MIAHSSADCGRKWYFSTTCPFEDKVGFMILEDSFYDMPPVKRGRRGVSDADDEDDDYRRRRDRNNEVISFIYNS